MLKIKINGDVKVPLSGFTRINTTKHSVVKGVVKDGNGVSQTIFKKFGIPTLEGSSINLPYMYGYTSDAPTATPITNSTKARSFTFGSSKNDLLSYYFTLEMFDNIDYKEYNWKEGANDAPDGARGFSFYASQGIRIPSPTDVLVIDTSFTEYPVDGGSMCRARNIPVGKDLVLNSADFGVMVFPSSLKRTDVLGEYIPVPQGFKDTWLIDSLSTKAERDSYTAQANAFLGNTFLAPEYIGTVFSCMLIEDILEVSWEQSKIKPNTNYLFAGVDFTNITSTLLLFDKLKAFVSEVLEFTPENDGKDFAYWLVGARNVPNDVWNWLISPQRFNRLLGVYCYANTSFNSNFSAVNTEFAPKSGYAKGWISNTPFNQPVENILIKEARGMFAGCALYNNTFTPVISPTVTDASRMFYYTTLFNQPVATIFSNNNIVIWERTFSFSAFNQPVSSMVRSSATDLTSMFAHARNFNKPLNGWDTSNVGNVSNWIVGSGFNQDINQLNWTNVVDARGLLNSSTFNQPIPDVRIPKATTVENLTSTVFNQPLEQIFLGNTVLEDIGYMLIDNQVFNHPLNNIDTSKVTGMSSVFRKASSFNQPLNNWDTSKVGTKYSFVGMANMFDGASAFDQDISMWDVSNVSAKNNFDKDTSPSWTAAEKPNFV